jgi:adenosylcobinamide kinase/adenosylcobinamide-phosphate guanylyltransferase
MNATITMILGGARSGKSARAEALAGLSERPVTYVATYASEMVDPEMSHRILAHRSRRPASWDTVENRFDLAPLFQELRGRAVVLDCLTLWLSFHFENVDEADLLARLRTSLQQARTSGLELYIVSNELGMGLVPSSPEGRAFRDLCGRANQLVAGLADRVEFQIAGLPLCLKGGLRP